jgi:hypothetical protein
MKRKLKTTLLLIASLFLINCGHIPTNAVLKLPPELVYPLVSAEEVSCLTDDAFNKIKKRDKLKSARIETLRNIIKATH